MVSGYLSRQTKEWGLNIFNGVHNHAMEPALEGHILAGTLKEDDKKIVGDLTKSKMLPKNILINLKNKRPHWMTNIKQVYIERQQIWKANRGDKTALQYLISKLEEHNYTYFSRTQSESTTIKDIFWAHPTSVKLFNNFLTVLVMDFTYKTNMYKDMKMPKVIVTDNDMSLMKAVENVFPKIYAMNCYFHVQANVKQRCILDCKYPLGKKDGKEVKHDDVVKKIMRAWKAMVESPTQELYANALVEFQDFCSDFPLFLKYVMTTLNEMKEKIVRAWTDHVLHLSCRTTNMVESAHALVMKYLDNSVGDLDTCWEKIHDMLVLQFNAIQTTFGQSITVLEHRFKDVTLYSGLGGHVSKYALDNIALEESRCRRTLCMNKEICGYVQRTSYGLPCAWEIATKIREEKLKKCCSFLFYLGL
uniref:Lambda integrase-like, N-terminal n=1 Tax=Medicago truncatula TaxID=3880 RepID=A2Q6C8_MEDTR|nr:Lambda integrase-like, N-terminal [Medicago truncatula]